MAACEEVPDVRTRASVSILVKQAGSATTEILDRGLREAGAHVVSVPTAYDVVVEAEQAHGSLEHVLLDVDHFGPGEFRLVPLVRREWPETLVVAYHSPGFEHKGRIAELVGADVVLSTPDDVSRFLASLMPRRATPPDTAPSTPPSTPAATPTPTAPVLPAVPSPAPPPLAATPAPPPVAPAVVAPQPTAPAPDTSPLEPQGPPPPAVAAVSTPPTVEPPPAREAGPGPAPQTQDDWPPEPAGPPGQPAENLDDDEKLAQGRILGTVELTDEELRTLLGEENEA